MARPYARRNAPRRLSRMAGFIGVGAGVTAPRNGGFDPRSLFASGEQGAWYDPSDMSALSQDAAGATPVTAVGQPVGMILDKRLGLVLGNALPLTVGGWTGSGSGPHTKAAGGFWAQLGGRAATSVVGKWFRIAFKVDAVTAGTQLSVYRRNAADTADEVVANITVSAGGSYSATVLVVSDYVNNDVWLDNFNFAGTVSEFSVKEIPGNHATQPTAASRPTLRQDASGYYYLEFDGVDDSLATASVDFSATNKMTLLAGVHKASDAARGVIADLGTCSPDLSPTGWRLEGPDFTPNNFGATVSGTGNNVDVDLPGNAPISRVLTAQFDLSQATPASQIIFRGNGSSAGVTYSGTAKVNTFQNAPIYIGRRGGTTLPFNGRLYGLIVRGAATDATLISRAERFVGSRMGIAL